jgi:Helicase conserved C-terminal domain
MSNTKSNPNGAQHAQPARWPVAARFRPSPLPLNEVIEAEFNAAQLRELAKWLDIKLKGSSKIGFTEQVTEAVQARINAMAESPDAMLNGLSAEQQDFVRRMFTARDHELPLSRGVALTAWARQYDKDADRRLSDVLDGLRRRALLFPTSPLQHGVRDVYYRWLPLGPSVPLYRFEQLSAPGKVTGEPVSAPALLDRFDAFLGALLKSPIELRTPLPAHEQSAKFAWLRDWEHDAEDAARVINSRPGWVPDPQTGIGVPLLPTLGPDSASRLEDQTGLDANETAFFFALTGALQLIEPANSKTGRLAKARQGTIEEWLVMTQVQKLRRLWRAWTEECAELLEARAAAARMRATDAFGLARAIGARDLSPAVLGAEFCALRRFVGRALLGLPHNAWVSWPAFKTALFEFMPEAAWTFAIRAEWWFTHAGSRSRLNPLKREDWDASIGRVIEQIIRNGMFWFGAVELRFDDGDLTAIRATGQGAWLLNAHGHQAPEALGAGAREPDAIAWQKDGVTLHAQPAPDRADFIAHLRRITDRGDGSFNYVITPASIERALAEGVTLEETQRKFKRAGVTLPRAISEQFKTAARRYGRVRVYQALTVLELADELTAREVAANTSLSRRAVYQLSPRVFVLPDEEVDTLVEEMQAKGYTPRTR